MPSMTCRRNCGNTLRSTPRTTGDRARAARAARPGAAPATTVENPGLLFGRCCLLLRLGSFRVHLHQLSFGIGTQHALFLGFLAAALIANAALPHLVDLPATISLGGGRRAAKLHDVALRVELFALLQAHARGKAAIDVGAQHGSG